MVLAARNEHYDSLVVPKGFAWKDGSLTQVVWKFLDELDAIGSSTHTQYLCRCPNDLARSDRLPQGLAYSEDLVRANHLPKGVSYHAWFEDTERYAKVTLELQRWGVGLQVRHRKDLVTNQVYSYIGPAAWPLKGDQEVYPLAVRWQLWVAGRLRAAWTQFLSVESPAKPYWQCKE